MTSSSLHARGMFFWRNGRGFDRSGDRQGVFQVILWVYRGGLRLAVR